MALCAGRLLALAAAGFFSLGLNAQSQSKARSQKIDYGQLPTLEEALGRDVDGTLERLNLKHEQWETVEKIFQYEAAALQLNRGDYNFSVADRLLREQQIRHHSREQIVAILTGEQRERLTKLMLRRLARAENRLDDY